MALWQACLTPPSTCDPSGHSSFLSTKTAQPSLLSTRPGLRHPPVSQAPGLEPIAQIFTNPRSKFADVLGSISSLYTEVGEENRAADEYMQRTTEESGRSSKDYERRALLFERSGEMVASSKLKGKRVMMELELLQEDVLECDEGRAAGDYLRRAQIFSKSAEVFASQTFLNDGALP